MNRLAGRDAVDLVRLLRAREVSAVEVVRDHIARINEVDPLLNAVLRTNPSAEEEAREADRQIAAGRAGPLAGIPAAIKDNLLTRGLETSCASQILKGFVPLYDATVVARLKSAGAIVLCKTNLDEFAMGSSTENSAFGPTRNPWDTQRVPGGSSGGSAAAVAAGMAPLALGSDTGGSVRQPAAMCGIVGLKPTYGRVSRWGLVAFGSSLDQVGPMATTVEDCASVLAAIAGADPRDSTSVEVPVEGYASACQGGVRGIRIGLPREAFGEGLDPEIDDAVRRAAAWLERDGARVEEVSLPHARFSIPTYHLVATAEASSNLARFDGVRFGPREPGDGSLKGMYKATRGTGFGREVKRRIMLGTFALSEGYYEAYYGKALRVRTLVREDFLRVFSSGVDLILTATTPTPAFRIGEKAGDPLSMYLSDVFTASTNLAGLPAISVPVGLSSNRLPIGAQITGPDFREVTVLRAAAVIERHVGRLVPPPIDGQAPVPAGADEPLNR